MHRDADESGDGGAQGAGGRRGRAEAGPAHRRRHRERGADAADVGGIRPAPRPPQDERAPRTLFCIILCFVSFIIPFRLLPFIFLLLIFV